MKAIFMIQKYMSMIALHHELLKESQNLKQVLKIIFLKKIKVILKKAVIKFKRNKHRQLNSIRKDDNRSQ